MLRKIQGRAWGGGVVWVLSDQNFPAILPSDGSGSCLKIVRAENYTMADNVASFTRKFGNIVKPGDVVLISAVGQLAVEGLAGYISSYLDVKSKLLGMSGGGCVVLPAPFLLADKCEDMSLIRSILEFHSWIRISGIDPDGIFNDALGALEHFFNQSPGGREVKVQDIHYMLPLNYPQVKKSPVVSAGITNLPTGVMATDQATEKLVITSLLVNLNEKFKLDLDIDPCTDRIPANSTNECWDLIIIGGSHAEMTAAQLKEKGHKVQMLSLPTYRTSSIHAGKIKEGLKGLTVGRKTAIVVQVFDSGLYMAAMEGSLIPPRKDNAGNYHIDGDLVLAPKELQWKFFQQLADELADLKTNSIIFAAPLPRYLDGGCCEDEDHVGNRTQEDFRKKLEVEIYTARTNIKNSAFRCGFKNAVTLSTWGAVKRTEDLWADPVQLTEAGYMKLADSILLALEELRGKKRRQLEGEAGPAPKKPRADPANTPAAPGRGRGAPRGRGGVQHGGLQQLRGGAQPPHGPRARGRGSHWRPRARGQDYYWRGGAGYYRN
jgi:hypothetical protein